jgi:hypothetical protein
MTVTIKDDRRNVVVVTDMDEVLVNISPKWYRKVRENWNIFAPYFRDLGDLTDLQVLQRPIYLMNDWLKKDEIPKLPEEIVEAYLSLYRDNNFYEDLHPTAFGKGIGVLSRQNFLEKIYIVSHTVKGGEDSKVQFFRKWFNHPKIELVMLPTSTPKSEYIKGIAYNTFIDDSPAVMYDVIKNTSSFLKEFMIPQLGYNDIKETHKYVLDAMEDYGCIVKSYENVL